MKSALAFLVLGPALAAAATLVVMAQTAGPAHDVAKLFATAVFFFTLPVSAITACIDGVLNDVPVPVRAALSATVGAIVAFSLAFILLGWFVPAAPLAIFAFGGAACMGVCSLLASEFSGVQHQTAGHG